jgi:hypothetical protein
MHLIKTDEDTKKNTDKTNNQRKLHAVCGLSQFSKEYSSF